MHEKTQKEIFDEWLSQHKGIMFKIIRAYAFNPHDQDDLKDMGPYADISDIPSR